MITKSTGWFFWFRGNGYGPYETNEEAFHRMCLKESADKEFGVPIDILRKSDCLYGTAHIDENKQLIKFERLKCIPTTSRIYGTLIE